MTTEFKSQAYFLVNQYISGIQCGIQAAHCAMELLHGNRDHATPAGKLMKKWLEEDKTMIVLNGGSQRDLMDVLALLKEKDLPYAYFNEEQDALNGALTCVGFVLDAQAVEKISKIREGGVWVPTFGAQVDPLLLAVAKLGLAR